jgi:hypothetical protein
MSGTGDRSVPLSARVPGSGIRRRTFVVGAGLGLVAAAAGAAPAQAVPNYSVIPTLPGEVTRTDTKLSRIGKKPYETIDVVNLGDRARLYVPHAMAPRSRTAGAVVWFYHSHGSSYTAMDGPYAYSGMLLVDQGAVSVCPYFGGVNTWTTQRALTHQTNWSKYMSSVFTIGRAFARANSGGGSLMTYAYGTDMVPAMRGMYLANATYDMEDLYARDPARVGPPYNNDPALIAATNPARLPQSSWSRKRLKTVVSLVDPVVPPQQHGLALASLAQPVAADVRIQYHNDGHNMPAFANQDMIATFKAWV